jgi:hypothetical protein
MLHIQCQEHFNKVKAFAEQVGAMDRLQRQLDYLGKYACHNGDDHKTRCDLWVDSAPYSFTFTMMRRNEKTGGYENWFNGGLIYSGPGQPLNGSFPALVVSLDPEAGKEHSWSVHT